MQKEELQGNHVKWPIKTRESRKTGWDKTKIQQIENSYEYGRY